MTVPSGDSVPEDVPRPREPEDFPLTGPNSLAAIHERGIARVIDLVIEVLPLGVLVALFADVNTAKQTVSIPAWIFPLCLGLFVLYETVLVAWRGQTIGKMVLGVRVARLVNGSAPDPSHAALRAMVPATVLAIPIVQLATPLVYLSSMFNPIGRGVHDSAAGTVVVRSR
jgi:uncharacterized RDD family membrane protein YckC